MKRRTVRGTLFGTYTIIIMISFFALVMVLAGIRGYKARTQTIAVLEQSAHAAATAINRELDTMRTTALNISYSTRMQDLLFPHSSDLSDASEAEKLSTFLSVIVFPNRPVDEVNLYTRDGLRISSGMHNEIAAGSAQEQDWYAPMLNSGARQMVFFSGPDETLAKYVTDINGKQFISLVIENYDQFNVLYGYIEIKQRLSRVISSIIDYDANYGERMYLFDGEGRQIYPLEGESEALFSVVRQMDFPSNMQRATVDRSDVYICCVPSDSEDFYAVMVLDHADLLSPVWDHIATLIPITLLVLALAIILSHIAARRITAPIATICEQIDGIDIEQPTALPPINTEIAEMHTLHDAFTQMLSTLSEHVNKLLLLQDQEMQSRMLALQAQMNPHFLFNSLQALQAMAEEGMDEEISVMCQSIASILRYISSDSKQTVPLKDELRYTVDYLTCMSIRYQGDLEYVIDIPEALNEVAVPKLCVQPLVENAIKFTTSRRPPYRIRITGTVEDGAYELRIQDNGPGFAKETLDALNARMEEIRRTSMLPSLKINGMGLLNIFIRFYLLCDKQFVFRLENNPEGGACVAIGAKQNESKI